MSKTARLGLPYIMQAQAQKEVTHNQALNMLDVYINPTVEAIVYGEPTKAKEASVYIINNKLAQFTNGSWTYYPALDHMEVMVLEENKKFVFNKNKWTPLALSTEAAESSRGHLEIKQWEEDLKLSGKVATSKNIIPHHSSVIAVNIWVIEAITGVPSFAVGVKEDPSRYGDKLSSSKNTTNIGMTNHPITYYYDTPIMITPNQMEFTGGIIRLSVQYLKPQGAWPW